MIHKATKHLVRRPTCGDCIFLGWTVKYGQPRHTCTNPVAARYKQALGKKSLVCTDWESINNNQ